LMAAILICPQCAQPIELPKDEDIICACQKKYRVLDGVVDFLEDDTYYGELPQAEMQNLLSKAKKEGWQQVLFDSFWSSHPFLYQIATDEARADWQFLLPITNDFSVLDVGAGWGTISVPLARNCRQVVAMDGTIERLQFIKIRCEQDGISNVTPIRGNILAPPFQPQQFDLIVMSGVLEWVAESDLGSDPEDLQKQALKNTFNLLKPGGIFYMAIENKYGFKYFLGAEDDHTCLRNISFLSREEADRYSQIKRGKPYRTYTYSLPEYRDLLEEAGFGDMESFYPMPDYKTALNIAPLDDSTALQYYLSNICDASRLITLPHSQTLPFNTWHTISNFEKAAVDVGVADEFASSFILISHKD